MRYWIGITDFNWFEYLAARPDLDEVNFWQPSAKRMPVNLEPGAPFLFKLHAAQGGAIVGGGFFLRYDRVPVYLAWDAFGEKNGASSEEEMITRIQRYRGKPISAAMDEVGCTILGQPFFLPRERWIDPPEDWARNIVQGKTYREDEGIGARVWRDVLLGTSRDVTPTVAGSRFGTPTLVSPRLGQGSFRIAVTEAYQRRCAITGERTLPALDAAHIVPYAEHGEHRVDNGLLLRKDLHALFDAGYLSVRPDLRIAVSRRIHEEFENGRDYYALADKTLRVPEDLSARPNHEFLEWHYGERYLG